MDYNAEEDLTVETIIERGVKKYFPVGKSQLGYLKDMDLSLGSFAGENLDGFTEGNACSFQEYLKSRGLFSPQYHLYIRTKPKQQTSSCTMEVQQSAGSVDESDEEELNVEETVTDKADENAEEDTAIVFFVNNAMPGNMYLKYKRNILSRYDNCVCTITYGSMRQCYNSSAHEIAYADYNCITDDGFLLVHVELGYCQAILSPTGSTIVRNSTIFRICFFWLP
ncbi:hypothetical protein DPMN_057109 [Dreissena polymorpha]|uniref:Uncharacterized protein n=1 Tax=Dreissena polymorpha TaxID=45954 RepID=A0A9D4CSZ9_DREPO|nr:hypothetical protein DPMN_057109 [Dreissena polymorpha]